ncbi:DUF4236 domain-containing protein [Methylosinus sp. PW1]|uniref:DUF4236 domain-containing protein n=1 Tax=Methylosinus sp. PW1 TaxID=107636 RepID=UPI00211021FB|nr:DUF4236 domain-containing protein [Methylosinus sp. PW1]
MPLYFRRSISAGPFRFNLSKSGIGVSVGIKGLRIGSGPRGNYVHMGVGGIYYRASLEGSFKGRESQTGSREPLVNRPAEGQSQLAEMETANLLELVPTTPQGIIDQINQKMSLFSYWPIVIVVGLFVFGYAYNAPQLEPAASAIFVFTIVISIFAWYYDRMRKVVVVLYDIDDGANKVFSSVCREFDVLSKAARIWNVDTHGWILDWKRNAGANSQITRSEATIVYSLPSVLKSNISVPCVTGGKTTIYFFPDMVMIAKDSRITGINYDQLSIHWADQPFIESERVPHDGQIINHTWAFVNKDGGPDRRFNNNRQIPVVLYQSMLISCPTGTLKNLYLSKNDNRYQFDAALKQLDLYNKGRTPQADAALIPLANTEAEVRNADRKASSKSALIIPSLIAGGVVGAILIMMLTAQPRPEPNGGSAPVPQTPPPPIAPDLANGNQREKDRSGIDKARERDQQWKSERATELKRQAELAQRAELEKQAERERQLEISQRAELQNRADREREEEEMRTQAGLLCDQAAANPTDPRKPASVPGVPYGELQKNSESARRLCEVAVKKLPNEPRYRYQLARAVGFSDPTSAAEIYKKLTRERYPAAFDNLASLLLQRKDRRQMSQVVALLHEGIRLGDPDSMVTMAALIDNSIVVHPDGERAKFMLLERAARLGHAGARLAIEQRDPAEEERNPEQHRHDQEMFLQLLGNVIGGVLRTR